jgi:signal transduction histidine kinase
MAATDVTVLSRPRDDAEPLLGRIMASVLFVLFLITLSINEGSFDAVRSQALHLLVWALLILVMNLLPVTVGDVQLTLDLPLLLGAAMLYGPESAALVAFIATVDSRNVSREGLSPWRSLFNRSQVALSIWVAGVVFYQLSPGLLPLTRSVPGLAVALLADYLVNTGAVVLHVAVTRRIGLRESARRLVEHPLHFIATYLGYAALSLVLAMLYERVGLWSVVAFLLPLVGARQLLLKGQALERLAEDLRQHEALLRRALARVDTERRSERMRIAADLHDDVLQSLIHVRMLGRLLEGELQGPSSGRGEAGAPDAHDLRVSADRAIDGLRDVISGLSTTELEAHGLVATLQRLLDRLERDWRVEIYASLPTETHLDGDIDLVVYQTTREAVLNALKHSNANRVEVALEVSEEEVSLDVRDDGVGFVLDALAVAHEEQHFGLGLIRSRVETMAGAISIDSSPGKGTRLRASIPLPGGREAQSRPRP